MDTATFNALTSFKTLLLTNETMDSADSFLTASGMRKVQGKLEWRGPGTYASHAVLVANDDGTFAAYGLTA